MKEIAILGTGCNKCDQLFANATEAIEALGLDCSLRKVTEVAEIMKFGVMMTPALAIDGDVKVVGKVLSTDEIKEML